MKKPRGWMENDPVDDSHSFFGATTTVSADWDKPVDPKQILADIDHAIRSLSQPYKPPNVPTEPWVVEVCEKLAKLEPGMYLLRTTSQVDGWQTIASSTGFSVQVKLVQLGGDLTFVDVEKFERYQQEKQRDILFTPLEWKRE